MLAHSANGISFTPAVIFQDSSGVPSVVRWKSDTLVCVFQWFRQPINSLTWDRVAVKYSYDGGSTWTQPEPVLFDSIPATYQRPFDPTLAVLSDGRLRMYFSSSDGMPIGNDSIINTYSAISTDGMHFRFEPGARADEPSKRLIDPAVIFFNSQWQYLSPAGAPQEGAFHYISTDGLSFTKISDISSDSIHNWTGNFLVLDSLQQLRFYGCGQGLIWFNSSGDGMNWIGYVNTNIAGGDPAICRNLTGDYILIFVNASNTTGIVNPFEREKENLSIRFYQEGNRIHVVSEEEVTRLQVFDLQGRKLLELEGKNDIYWDQFSTGVYIFRLITSGQNIASKMLFVHGGIFTE